MSIATKRNLQRFLLMNNTYITLTKPELSEIIRESVMHAIIDSARVTGELWGNKEVARHLGIASRTVTKYIAEGRLPMPVHGKWRKADILAIWEM